jgi:hypothetical protein
MPWTLVGGFQFLATVELTWIITGMKQVSIIGHIMITFLIL